MTPPDLLVVEKGPNPEIIPQGAAAPSAPAPPGVQPAAGSAPRCHQPPQPTRARAPALFPRCSSFLTLAGSSTAPAPALLLGGGSGSFALPRRSFFRGEGGVTRVGAQGDSWPEPGFKIAPGSSFPSAASSSCPPGQRRGRIFCRLSPHFAAPSPGAEVLAGEGSAASPATADPPGRGWLVARGRLPRVGTERAAMVELVEAGREVSQS